MEQTKVNWLACGHFDWPDVSQSELNGWLKVRHSIPSALSYSSLWLYLKHLASLGNKTAALRPISPGFSGSGASETDSPHQRCTAITGKAAEGRGGGRHQIRWNTHTHRSLRLRSVMQAKQVASQINQARRDTLFLMALTAGVLFYCINFTCDQASEGTQQLSKIYQYIYHRRVSKWKRTLND